MKKLKNLFAVLFLFVFSLNLFAQTNPIKSKNTSDLKADLLIVGGMLVTMDKDRRVIEDGAVAVKDGKILFVGKRSDVPQDLKAKQTINAQGKVIIPGLINTHTHIPMTMFRGITDDLSGNGKIIRRCICLFGIVKFFEKILCLFIIALLEICVN